MENKSLTEVKAVDENSKKAILHYGATVYLKHEDDGTEYLTYGEGFSKIGLALKTKEEFIRKNLYLNGLFRIYPSFYNNEYEKSKRKFDECDKEINPTETRKREAKREIKQLSKNLDEEVALNFENFEKIKGTPVLYGEIIQLMHVASKKFARFDPKKSSEYEGDNFRLELSEEYSEETCFRILPSFTFSRENGNQILDDDKVFIRSALDQSHSITGEPFIQASKLVSKKKHGQAGIVRDKREANVSTEKKSSWSFSIFSEYLDERGGFLSYGDILWINYSEQDLSLIARRVTKTHRTADRRQSKEASRWLFELISCESSEKYRKFVGNTNGLFIIESENMIKGGRVQWDRPFRLRHFPSNSYICLNDVADFHNEKVKLALHMLKPLAHRTRGKPKMLSLTPRIEESKLLQFEIIYSTITTRNKEILLQYLEKDSYFRMHTAREEPKLWLNTIELPAASLKPVMDNVQGEVVICALMSEERQEESIFKLAKANSADLMLTSFLISAQNTIRRVIPLLDPQEVELCRTENISYFRSLAGKLSQLHRTVEDLDLFCNNKLRSHLSFDQPFGVRNHNVQNILREQLFIELLIQILYTSFPTLEALSELKMIEVTASRINEFKVTSPRTEVRDAGKEILQKKLAICDSVYRLMISLACGNKDSELYIFRFLPFFQIQSQYITSAFDCIISIMENNEELLLNIYRPQGKQAASPSKVLDSRLLGDRLVRGKLKGLGIIEEEKVDIADDIERLEVEDVYQAFSKVSRFKDLKRWDALSFYIELYLRTESDLLKTNLLRFFITTATWKNEGLNVNQELLFEKLSNQHRGGVTDLIRVFSTGDKLYIKTNLNEYPLELLFSKEYNTDKDLELDDADLERAQDMAMFQLEFIAAMCKSRNYTWKNLLEQKISMNALITSLSLKIDDAVKGYLSMILMALYIDQEPMKEVVYPRLCKIADVRITSMQSSAKSMESSGRILLKKVSNVSEDMPLEEDVNPSMTKVQLQMVEAILEAERRIDELPLEVTKEWYPDQEIRLEENFLSTYNFQTYQTIRLVKLMMKFGQFMMQEGAQNDAVTRHFQAVARALFTILEYERSYPETRKTLVDKRRDEVQAKRKRPRWFSVKGIVMKILGLIGLPEDDGGKKGKKRLVALEFSGEGAGSREYFLIQSEVIKQLLGSVYLENSMDEKIKIKLEVLEMIEYLLDYKLDLYLDHMKSMFVKNVRGRKRPTGGSDFLAEDDISYFRSLFKKKVPRLLRHIFPEILRTGTSVDDEDSAFNDPERADSVPDPLNLNQLFGFNVLPSLLQLFVLTANQELKAQILRVIIRLYNSRMELLTQAKDMLLLFDQDNIRVHQACLSKLKNLTKLCETAEKWMNNNSSDPEKIKEATDMFEFLNNVLIAGAILESEDSDTLILPHSDADLRIDPIRQEMLRHLGAQTNAIQIVRDCIHLVQAGRENDQNIVELFSRVFAFLKNYVQNCPDNQNELSESLVILIFNLESDVGQVELICEIFRNNTKICLERAPDILDDFIRLIVRNGRQLRYLTIFEIVQQEDDGFLYQNQKLVLNLFLEPQSKATLLYLNETTTNLSGRATFSFLKQQTGHDEPFDYHARMIDVLTMTANGKDGLYLNETRLRSLFNVRYFLELLSFPDPFTSPTLEPPPGLISLKENTDRSGIAKLKLPIVNFLYYVFFESEKVGDDFLRYAEDFVRFVDLERRRIETLRTMTKEYVTYLFEGVIRVVNCFLRAFISSYIERRVEEDNDVNEIISKFAMTIERHMTKFPSGGISREGEFQLAKLLESFGLLEGGHASPSPNVRKQKNNERKSFTPRIGEMSEDEAAKRLWEIYIDTLFEDQATLDAVRAEHFVLAKAINSIEDVFGGNDVAKDVVNRSEITLSIVSFLQQNFTTREHEELNLMLLNLLGNMIQSHEDKEAQAAMQKFLNERDASFMVLSQLSNTHLDDNLFNHLVSFGIKLLNDGNNEVQKSFYFYFTNFPSSEIFFQKVHQRIEKEMHSIKQTEKDILASSHEDKLKEKFLKLKNPMFNILRFLQLFTEGHYLELQNYVHNQDKNYHSHDLIKDILELLAVYMNVSDSTHLENMIQCFDTLTEFIQGPCYENQLALTQGGFLETASKLFDYDEVAIERFRNFDSMPTSLISFGQQQVEKTNKLSKWMMARLKYKCSITLLSILEARKDNGIVTRMMNSFQLDVIKRNISDIYLLFREHYNGTYSHDIFGHFLHDPNEGEFSEEYCSFVVETGFNLFILLSYFAEARPKSEDNNNDPFGDPDNLKDQDSLLKNNIVGQIGSLGFTLVRTGFKSLAGLTSDVWNKTKMLKSRMMRGSAALNQEEDHNMILRELNDKRNEVFPQARAFFDEHTAHIEVLRKGEVLERAYFYIPPFCKAISKETKIDFNQKADRKSAKAKVTSLFKESHLLITNIKHEHRLNTIYNKIAVVGAVIKNISLIRDLAFLLALTINLFILIIYVKDPEGTPIVDDPSLKSAINGLGYSLIVLSLIITIYFLAKTAPLLVAKAWEGVTKSKINLLSYAGRLIKMVYLFMTNFEVLYYVVYGLTAFLALTINPFFFAFHLFDVLMRYPTLRSVIQSVWIPKKLLFFTFFLMLILDYIYSLMGYYWISDSYEGWCPNTFICWLTSIDKSFKADGGLGGFLALSKNFVPGIGPHYTRFAFDNSYMLLIMLILLNIILGIIIDTFRRLREEERNYNEDVRNICFICGFNRDTIDKASDSKRGFDDHIKKDHYMWNYLFYIAYIEEKESTEYSGIESYVAEKIEKKDVTWFPSNRAIALNEKSSDDETQKNIECLRKLHAEQEKLLIDSNNILEVLNEMEAESYGRRVKKDRM